MDRPTSEKMFALEVLKPQVAEGDFNRDLIEAALERSPTGGNSKPFYWTWDGMTLHIRYDQVLAEHYLNRNHHTSWIALGCMIASAEIAAQFSGHALDVSVSEKDLSASLKFAKSKIMKTQNELMSALLNRSTYRGSLKASEAPSLTPMNSASKVQLRLQANQGLTSAMKAFLTQADSYLWLQSQATRSFFHEIQFTHKPQQKEDRGIRVVDLGIGKMDQLMLRFFSWRPQLATFFARIPGLNLSFRAASVRSQKNAHYILLSATDLRPMTLVKVGQEAMKAWLEMEKQGYKVQPISMASITLLDAARGVLPHDTLQKFRSLFTKQGPDALSQQFHLKADEKPIWLLRVGRPDTKS